MPCLRWAPLVSGPTEPRPGRHASPDPETAAGRAAAELLAAWARAGSTVGVAEQRPGGTPAAASRAPHRSRFAPDAGSEPPAGIRRPAAEVAWPSAPARPAAAAGAARTSAGTAPWPVAPRTAAMPAVAPRVPAARPVPRQPGEGPDRLDHFPDADTAPGVPSGTGRPRPGGRRSGDRAHPAGRVGLRVHDAELPTADLHVGDRVDALVHGGPQAADDDGATGHDRGLRGRTATGMASRYHPADDEPDALGPEHDHPEDVGHPVFDETGGLEVVVDEGSRYGGPHDLAPDDFYDDGQHDHPGGDGGGPGGGRGRRGGGRGGRRRNRRPIAAILSLLVLAAVVVGVVVGGQALWRTINPPAKDYAGAGTGSVDIRINDGDSLRTIAGTLVDSGVIASSGPFLDAAKAHPQATGIQPGLYRLHQQMSGSSALNLLMDPASRQLSRITVPEGLTVAQTLQRIADNTGIPLPDLQAAAMDTVSLGLPPYANGMLEGFLFPATYDVEPGTSAAGVLEPMVARAVDALDSLGVPVDQRLTVITKASIVQAESGSVEDMGKIARVLENRLSDGMPLQLDTTVNYANGKNGVTTTPEDRANPSPYNTYLHTGLPPGAISNPGEQAIEAVLSPTPGNWRFFVVVDPHTGDTRFAVTAEEHQQNVLLFQQWLRDHPNG
jgi:UPF0755 protein